MISLILALLFQFGVASVEVFMFLVVLYVQNCEREEIGWDCDVCR